MASSLKKLKVIIIASNDQNLPASCSGLPKSNLGKQQWLTSNLRENLCHLWECSMDLVERGNVLVFDGNTHTVKPMQEVPHDPDDPLNTVTEVLRLKQCVNIVLGHKKLNCAIDFKSYVELTACSLGMDHTQDESLEQIEKLFKAAFSSS